MPKDTYGTRSRLYRRRKVMELNIEYFLYILFFIFVGLMACYLTYKYG